MTDKELKKLCFLNRQPSLFRHGCVGMEIIPADDDDDKTIGLSPLALEPLNADFDGDSSALYVLHDQQSLNEINNNAFLKSYILYDSSDEMLATIRHEALYCAFLMTSNDPDYQLETININNLNEIPENITLYNQLSRPVKINNNVYSYGLCLFNKWCGFNHIVIDYPIVKKQSSNLSKIIHNYFNNDNEKYYNQIAELEKRLFYIISVVKESPTINLDDLLEVLKPNERKLLQKLPEQQPHIGYFIHKGISNRCVRDLDKNKQLFKLFKSGSRFSQTQLERAVINIGYSANFKNQVVATPIKTNLISGLTEEEFFMSADGTRKAIADNAKSTPDSGFLERSLVMVLSPLELYEEDCGSNSGLTIQVMSEGHAQILSGKYYKDPDKLMPWSVLDFNTAKQFINRNLIIRSPMTCQTENFKLCKKCFGERYFPTKYVGITAGQVIAERLTQLTLRTFHQSGSAQLTEIPEVEKLIENHLIDIYNDHDYIVLEFDVDHITQTFDSIYGFEYIDGNKVYFSRLEKPLNNKDTVSVLNKIKDLLKIQNKNIEPPVNYYQKMTSLILSVGTPYSSFIEMLFANMFVVSTNPLRFWRYNQSETIQKKYGDKSLAPKISKLLGLLYQPNLDTVQKMDNLNLFDLDEDKLTIYEKIFLENL